MNTRELRSLQQVTVTETDDQKTFQVKGSPRQVEAILRQMLPPGRWRGMARKRKKPECEKPRDQVERWEKIATAFAVAEIDINVLRRQKDKDARPSPPRNGSPTGDGDGSAKS